MIDSEFLKNQTVLFVEDEELAREKLAKLLSKLFKTVILAINGEEGLKKFKESYDSDEKIDLIISDINMPIMNGLEMIERIREIDLNVPLIFTTARSETENIIKAIDLNVSSYIIKPIDTTLLIKKISDACEKQYIQSQLDEKQYKLKKYLEAVDNVALIYKMDGDGNISFANKSLLETSKYTIEELKEIGFSGLIHPDIPKEYIEKTWESLKKGDSWTGNTKFLAKNGEAFYLKNTIFSLDSDSKTEYITIGFSTTKENIEKREFQKKVIKALQEFNKKEYFYKKQFQELTDRLNQLESYVPRLQEELEEQKAKTLSRQRQLDHYELQMHNVDEKYYGHMTTKSKEAEEYAKNVALLKQEKATLVEKVKSSQEEILATKKELALLTEMNEQKNKRIEDLKDVIKSLEEKVKELTENNHHSLF